MTVPPTLQLFPNSPSYVGRDEQKALLQQETRTIAEQPTTPCRVVYIESSGGLGKTRLLAEYPTLVQPVAPDVRIARLVDFYQFLSRTPDAIESALINGLKQTGDATASDWCHLPPADVEAAFASYDRVHRAYQQAQRGGRAVDDAPSAASVRAAFVAGWNVLAATYPMVMMFDTLEAPYNAIAPAGTLAYEADGVGGAGQIIGWMDAVLPHLRRTLVLLSGRPLDSTQYPTNPIVQHLQERLVAVATTRLTSFQHPDEVRAFLRDIPGFDHELDDERVNLILQFTDGRPLLISAYAEMMRRTIGALPGFPPAEPPPPRPNEFEQYIIDTILSPNRLERSHPRFRTYLRCLYILSVARRGVTRATLTALYQTLYGDAPDADTVHELNYTTFVKELPPVISDTPDEYGGQGMLFLHDRVFELIDRSDYAHSFEEIAEQTYDELITQSRTAVQQARQQIGAVVNARDQVLQAMVNHVYYAVLKDRRLGYRVASVYIEQLLDTERNVSGGMLLSSTFWSALQDYQRRRNLPDFAAALRDGAPHDNLYQHIIAEGLVHRVKRVAVEDNPSGAVQEVAAVRDEVERYHYPYAQVMLLVAEGEARIKSQSLGSPDVFNEALRRLADVPQDEMDLLWLRRERLRGVIYRFLSYLAWQQQDYTLGAEYDREALHALRLYASTYADDLNDDVGGDILQAGTNYSYNLAQVGEFDKARKLAERTLLNHAERAAPYRRGLAYNSYALILLQVGELIRGKAALQAAIGAAEQVQSRRLSGMVAITRGLYAREQDAPVSETEAYFREAVQLLAPEPDQQREALFRYGGFARQQMLLPAKRRADHGREYWKQEALSAFDRALQLLGDGSDMQRAEYLKSKGAVYMGLREYDSAVPLFAEARAYLQAVTAPAYVHTIAGKLAFHRSVLLRERDHDYAASLVYLAVALARMYLFAPQHRDQRIIEGRIEHQLTAIPEDALHAFTAHLAADDISALPGEHPELTYQVPDPATWSAAFRTSTAFLSRAISDELELRLA